MASQKKNSKKSGKKSSAKKSHARKFVAKKKTGKNAKKTIKKAAKAAIKSIKSPAKAKLLGKVTHFYPNISVAIVEVGSTIKQGDTLNFIKNKESFKQKVTSMQIDYNKITEAKKGNVIGIKVIKPAKEGTLVYAV